MQRLHASGLGTKKKQAEPILPDEEAGDVSSFMHEPVYIQHHHSEVTLFAELITEYLYTVHVLNITRYTFMLLFVENSSFNIMFWSFKIVH